MIEEFFRVLALTILLSVLLFGKPWVFPDGGAPLLKAVFSSESEHRGWPRR